METFARWRAGVLSFETAKSYDNPFLDLSIRAVFTGPNGERLVREAYWDGGRTYRISFAPTAVGSWQYILQAPADSGLSGVSGSLLCIEYTGEKEIYRHGFLRVSQDGRYLTYADGMPFFWLGDTHWGFATDEKWDVSNHPQMSSMFRGMVDRRVEQHFTVYQTNLRSEYWLFPNHRYWVEGREGELPNVTFYQQELDRRMQYIADAGLVNAMGFSWSNAVLGRIELHQRLARYIIARYGALPIVWTLAGEAAGYNLALRQETIDGWREVARAIEDLDSYGHLQTVHYNTRRPFEEYYQDEKWFDFTLNQAGHGDFPIGVGDFRQYHALHHDKPFVEGESLYENCSTLEPIGSRRCTPAMLRRVAYMAIQTGGCGYTYGAQGIWDTQYETPTEDERSIFNQYGVTWYESIDAPGADQLGWMRQFYLRMQFEQLYPAPELVQSEMIFGDPVILELRLPLLTASAEHDRMIAYYLEASLGRYTYTGLQDTVYQASWFDPRTGEEHPIGRIHPDNGCWQAPTAPGKGDWLLVLCKS